MCRDLSNVVKSLSTGLPSATVVFVVAVSAAVVANVVVVAAVIATNAAVVAVAVVVVVDLSKSRWTYAMLKTSDNTSRVSWLS